MSVEAWTEGPRAGGLTVDNWHLATLAHKCTCGDDVDDANQVKMAIDQIKQGARGPGDQAVKDDTH